LRALRLWRRPIYRLARPFIVLFGQIVHGVTGDVRGVVVNGQGEVLLVEHTYVAGWHLPGGGVERNESAEAALARELVEEAGVRLAGPAIAVPRFLGGDGRMASHLFKVELWEPCEPTARGEILARGWFYPDALPKGATHWTRRRIERALAIEYQPVSESHPKR